ncbi:HAMP domain-containing sensor histidine kinase [Puniceibacterium sp. IMCC21224]|uniref:sensor histidine kinase n=1 Tax=Puniceibacterium sp. IMCC21224 TaxID=1618204 RepID=UPI00064E0D26|nr:HAMP domain-containing sensor histidine kinase [Puniceibacterium sp. IMCC21224]KMK66933.1 signal transduction histidine kinase [Puniceibacterium sp. IMCC21224]
MARVRSLSARLLPGNVLSGAAFKGALLSAGIVLVVLGATGASAYFYVQSTMIGVLQSQIRQEQLLFNAILQDSGPAALRSALTRLEAFDDAASPRAAALFDRTGARLAGNISTAPDVLGWSREVLTMGHRTESGRYQTYGRQPYYITSMALSGTTLVVGRSLDLVETTEQTLLRALLLSGALVLVAILTTGYLISRQSLRKLQGMEVTLDQVSQGNMAARLTVSPDNDQIDRISRRMNTHLDRLSKLMTSTRASAAAIAHDLKTPLARAYLGLEEATRALDAGRDPRAALDSSQEDLASLNTTFETILRILRIEAHGSDKGVTPMDLGPLVADLAETFRAVAEDNNQTLTLTPAIPTKFMVAGDAQMLTQMLVNLLQNAVTHTPPGAALTVALTRDTGAVTLTVSDNGPGIPPDDRERVFDPFFRGSAPRSDTGSGLGLALAKAVADRHNATIALSDNAPGLCVTVTFPALTP